MRLATATLGMAILAGAAGVGAQQAAAPSLKRTVLQQVDFSQPGHEAVTAIAELPVGATSGRHSHPGEEIGYVMEGTLFLELDGKPAMTLEAGKTFSIPSGAIHNATNKTNGTVKILSTYLVEKGKPLATPAPAK